MCHSCPARCRRRAATSARWHDDRKYIFLPLVVSIDAPRAAGNFGRILVACMKTVRNAITVGMPRSGTSLAAARHKDLDDPKRISGVDGPKSQSASVRKDPAGQWPGYGGTPA